MADPIDPLYKYSINEYPTDGVKTEFEISFAGGYISRDYVRVKYTDALGVVTYPPFTWLGDYQLSIAPAQPAGGIITIYRETPADVPVVDFADNAIMNETTLDINARQAVHLAAETRDVIGTIRELDMLQESLRYALDEALNRSNHTGTQLASTISDLADVLDALSTYVRNRANHTGTQPIETVAGLPAVVDRVGAVENALTTSTAILAADIASARAYAIQRANHTGTQAPATITGLPAVITKVDNTATDLANYKPLVTAAISDAQGYAIQRANHTGTQAISTVSGLQAALNDKAANTVVTTSANGLMIAADKVKLNGVAVNATANAGTVTSVALTPPTGFTSSGSVTTSGSLSLAYASGYQGFTTVEATTLSGIAANATANATDASLRARSSHTGTQAISTVSGLQGALDAKQAKLVQGANIVIDNTDPASPVISATGGGSGGGGVVSVNLSGGTTGLTVTGGPVTDAGTLTLGGFLNLANLEQGVDGSFVVGRLTTTGNVGRIAATNAATANTIPVRGSGGVVAVGTPTAADHAVTLGYAGSTYQALSGKDAANGYAGLDASGKINANQLPALAVTDTFPVASQAAMLALTAQVGDIAIRSDTSQSFILRAEPASTLANWSQLLTPASGVTSVTLSGGTTGLGVTGGTVTSTGTMTITINDAAAMRSNLGLVVGTHVQAWNARLDGWATKDYPVGAVVGVTDSQQLTNKMLFNPTIQGYTERVTPVSGTAFTVGLAGVAVLSYTTTGNATVTLPAAAVGQSFTVYINYGGAHTLTWAGTIRWVGGVAPTPTSVSGKTDAFTFTCVAAGTWFGFPSGANI